MTRELLLFRHGKSAWNTGVDDFHRPLKERGVQGAQRMGAWLLQQQLVPDYLVTSPAQRARDTAERAGNAMGLGTDTIHRDERIYAAGVDQLLRVLADCPQAARRVMLVGHNPGLEDLLDYLVEDQIPLPDDAKILPTATLARLRMPNDWHRLAGGSATLLSITRPASLPAKFPFPTPEGTELRDRPAYYYDQSAVIAYRMRDGKPEVLIISSSSRKHWVIPKGIKEPGLSPWESAAKEAREEAGVEGKVADSIIGTYRYRKWGADCTVDVYPMEVTRMLPEKQWEERHRDRQWVSPEEAAQRLNQEAIKPMLAALVRMLK